MHKQKSVSEGLSLLTKMASSKLHSAPLISQFKNVASPPAAFANNLLTKSCKWLLINSESGFWVMKLISFCGHAEDKLPSTLPRNHSETAPPPAAVACDTYLFVVCLFVCCSLPQVPALLQSKPVCRMRIPVPAPALPRRRLPPAKPDRGTRFVKRNGRAKPAWARPPSCFLPAPKGTNKTPHRNSDQSLIIP